MKQIRKTPEDVAANATTTEMREWILEERNPRNIQKLCHRISVTAHCGEYELARTAIEILIADSADRISRRVVRLTWVLILLTIALLSFTAYLTYDAYLNNQGDNQRQPHTGQK